MSAKTKAEHNTMQAARRCRTELTATRIAYGAMRAVNAALVTALGDLIRDHAATLAEHGIPASECGAIDNARAALARAKGSA